MPRPTKPNPEKDFAGGTPPPPAGQAAGVHTAAPDGGLPVATPEEGDLGSPAVSGADVPGETSQQGTVSAATRADDSAIPPAPPLGPEGDKTEAYLRWLAKYYPDEFRFRYAQRGGDVVKELLLSMTIE